MNSSFHTHVSFILYTLHISKLLFMTWQQRNLSEIGEDSRKNFLGTFFGALSEHDNQGRIGKSNCCIRSMRSRPRSLGEWCMFVGGGGGGAKIRFRRFASILTSKNHHRNLLSSDPFSQHSVRSSCWWEIVVLLGEGARIPPGVLISQKLNWMRANGSEMCRISWCVFVCWRWRNNKQKKKKI